MHAKAISSRSGLFRDIHQQDLNMLYLDVIHGDLRYVETIIAVIVDKALFRKTYAQNLPRNDFRLYLARTCFRNLIERLLYWNSENNCREYLLLILDDNAFGKLRGQERAYRDFIVNELRDGRYIPHLPCRKLFPVAAFADSRDIRLIQLADLVTWVIRRVIFRPKHAFLRIEDYISAIRRKIRQSRGRKLGYGIKLIPDALKNQQTVMENIQHYLLQ